MKYKQIIIDKLTQELKPSELIVEDKSNQHVGHLSDQSEETHFHIFIKAKQFNQLALLEMHQLVYKILAKEAKEIHSIALTTKQDI